MLAAEFLEKQALRLARRHARFANLSWRSAPLDDAPLGPVCGLIQNAWRRAYGGRISIAYRPALLRLARACAGHGGLATFAEDENGVCAAALGLPLDMDLPAGTGHVTLTTGFCTSAEHEKSGLVELLLARHNLACLQAGHAFSLHWRAGAGAVRATTKPTLSHAVSVPLYAKPLDCALAARHGQLSPWQGLGLRWLALRHPAGGRPPAGMELEPVTAGNAAPAASFLNAYQEERPLRRQFTAETLSRRCAWSEDGIKGAGWALTAHGRTMGVLYGYVNPVSDAHGYFALDGVVFDPGLTPGQARRALSAVEGMLRGQYGCFAVMVPGSACGLPLERMGYIPVRRYHAGAVDYQAVAGLTVESLGELLLELR